MSSMSFPLEHGVVVADAIRKDSEKYKDTPWGEERRHTKAREDTSSQGNLNARFFGNSYDENYLPRYPGCKNKPKEWLEYVKKVNKKGGLRRTGNKKVTDPKKLIKKFRFHLPNKRMWMARAWNSDLVVKSENNMVEDRELGPVTQDCANSDDPLVKLKNRDRKRIRRGIEYSRRQKKNKKRLVKYLTTLDDSGDEERVQDVGQGEENAQVAVKEESDVKTEGEQVVLVVDNTQQL